LVAAGITAWLVGQAIINIGAVVGLLPVTGVPLPFVSFGGSSLVIALFAAGVLANIATPAPRRRPSPRPPVGADRA
jgi:cell division protein FtsW